MTMPMNPESVPETPTPNSFQNQKVVRFPNVGADPFIDIIMGCRAEISVLLDSRQKPIFYPSEEYELAAAMVEAILSQPRE